MLIGKIIGIFLWICGLFVFISEFAKARRCSCEASAVNLDVYEDVHSRHNTHGTKRRIYYYPIIEFSTPEKTIRAKPRIKGYAPDTFVKGNQLDILYNPKNPLDLKLRENSVWDGIIGMGIFFLLGAILFYFSSRAG